MTSDAFNAMNLIASLRQKGVVFSDAGAQVPEHLTGGERQCVERRIEELTAMLTPGPAAWRAVEGLDTVWLEGLWGRLDEDDAFQDDITAERFDEIFYGWAEEELGPVDIGGGIR